MEALVGLWELGLGLGLELSELELRVVLRTDVSKGC